MFHGLAIDINVFPAGIESGYRISDSYNQLQGNNYVLQTWIYFDQIVFYVQIHQGETIAV